MEHLSIPKGFIFAKDYTGKKLTNHGCCGEFDEVVTMLRPNLVIPASREDALDQFIALAQDIRPYQSNNVLL